MPADPAPAADVAPALDPALVADPRPRVLFPGEPGSFAEDAVIAAFGEGVAATPVATFRDVVTALTEDDAPAGVLPIENVVFGTVRENYDLLADASLRIVGEVIVPVRLCLAALPFAFGSLRSGGFGKRLFIAIVIGVAFLLVQRLMVSLSDVYRFDARLAYLAPPVALMALCWGVFARRD